MPKTNSISEGTRAMFHGIDKFRKNAQNDSQPYLYGRVVHIILSESDPLFAQTNALESIQFEPFEDITVSAKSGDKNRTYLVAYKQNDLIRTPIINEIVPLYPGPDQFVQLINSQFSKVFYYGNSVAVYSATEHNATPDDNTLENAKTSTNKVNSYQQAGIGLNQTNPATDTVLSKDKLVLGEYFTEKGVKPLAPMEGDLKLQGRFGNSIRFGGTPSKTITDNLPWGGGDIGNPIIIIRNGQPKIDPKANWNAIFEDINQDGTSLYFTKGQLIKLVLASDNFDSYNQSNDNSAVKSNILLPGQTPQPVSESAGNIPIGNTEPVQQSFNIPMASIQGGPNAEQQDDLQNVPDNESDMNFVEIGVDIPVPVTQGVVLNNNASDYKFIVSVSPSSTNTVLTDAPIIKTSTTDRISNYAGLVSNVAGISSNGKALLDLVALAEGLLGAGNFNGYDVTVGNKLIPGFNTVTSSPPHPNSIIKVSGLPASTAAGRYQFLYSTWAGIPNTKGGMSKVNQDYACYFVILNYANVTTDMITRMSNDQATFNQVINMMASQWASLPKTNNPKGSYNQGGRFTFDHLYQYYQQILNKYSN